MRSVEEIKRLNMVDLLSNHYGMVFQTKGNQHLCLSPFNSEREPSFFVRRLEDGHWLFKDFSSGHGGSLIDFVLLKEGFSKVSDTLVHIQTLLRKATQSLVQMVEPTDRDKEHSLGGYDINDLYAKFKKNDSDLCRQYLIGRGIANEIVEDLHMNGILLHNLYKNQSYCCFAVFDQSGGLRCLDNHQINGESKFVLGKKDIFTRDFESLASAKRVFVCESIIDYLSMKTLYEGSVPGIALLGNVVRFSSEIFAEADEIMSALDNDSGGLSGLLDLREKFPDKNISVCNFGDCKDPNEFLQAEKKHTPSARLTAKDKLEVYKECMWAKNKTEVALKWGIHRSYMYQIIKECEEMILNGYTERRPGRKPEGAPANLDEATRRIAILEEEKHQEAIDKEKYYARSEFLKLRLKWVEQDVEEQQSKSAKELKKKKQIKKKKKKR